MDKGDSSWANRVNMGAVEAELRESLKNELNESNRTLDKLEAEIVLSKSWGGSANLDNFKDHLTVIQIQLDTIQRFQVVAPEQAANIAAIHITKFQDEIKNQNAESFSDHSAINKIAKDLDIHRQNFESIKEDLVAFLDIKNPTLKLN